jgi:hypothetical protein
MEVQRVRRVGNGGQSKADILLLEVLILFRNQDTLRASRSASTCLYLFMLPICCRIFLLGADPPFCW